MAINIDLTNELDLERPTITLNEKTYIVNDEKSNILKIEQIVRKGNTTDFQQVEKVIELCLGKEAKKEIDDIGYGIGAYTTIAEAIMAAIHGVSLEELRKTPSGK